MKEVINLGIIGCGTVANNYHWNYWGQLQSAQVTAVTDLSLGLARKAASRFGARVFASHRALIEEADVDALFIFIPPYAHTDQEFLAIRRGLPFFVEKPVSLSLKHGQEVAELLLKQSVITSVGYNWRYSKSVEHAKTKMGNHKIGMISGYWLGSAATGNVPAWWSDLSLCGGQLVEQSTHIVDLMRYFGGEVSTVYSQQARRLVERSDFTISDVGAVILEFSNGGIGVVVNACCLPPRSYRAGLEIIAEGLFLDVTIDRLRVFAGKEPEEYDTADDTLQNPYLLEDQIFVDAVRMNNSSAIRSTYTDALRTLAVTLAANESAKRKRIVKIDI